MDIMSALFGAMYGLIVFWAGKYFFGLVKKTWFTPRVQVVNHNAMPGSVPYEIDMNTGQPTLDMLLFLRMYKRGRPHHYIGEAAWFQYIHCEECGDKVFVFLLHKGGPITLDDDGELFPSDTLLTKLRLLRG